MSSANRSLVRVSAAMAVAAAALAVAPASHAADAGMRVVKDPVTGQLRAPTHEEVKEMLEQERKNNASLRRAAPAGSQLRRNAHGGISNEVGEKFMSFSVARRNADGTVTMICVPTEEAANKIVNSPQTAIAQEHAHEQQ